MAFGHTWSTKLSDYGGCIVCGQVIGKDEYLRCSDCANNYYMVQTGTKAKYIYLADFGPVDVTNLIEGIVSEDWIPEQPDGQQGDR
jgi:hypothetical protein